MSSELLYPLYCLADKIIKVGRLFVLFLAICVCVLNLIFCCLKTLITYQYFNLPYSCVQIVVMVRTKGEPSDYEKGNFSSSSNNESSSIGSKVVGASTEDEKSLENTSIL